MSYEGYIEYLCVNGHYTTSDCYDERVKKCPHCCGAIEYENSVDQTNGETEHPATRPGKKVEIGFDDDWRSDHYGNRYAAKVLRYAPASTSWTVCSQEPDPEPVRPPPVHYSIRR